MRYFFVNLAVHLIVTIAFVVLTCIFAGRNRKKKTKHILTYFFPILFALVAIIDIALYTAPRLMDINSMINSNYFYTTGTVDDIGYMKNYFVIDGEYYYMNPLHNKLNKGDVVRVEHTPYSSFTVEITKIADNGQAEDAEAIRETG
ncbi:MAG: hypothetical protein IKG03_04125 [Clostridiales bacterium]|nr:hypothetical protein [Clostridiales bacterium]